MPDIDIDFLDREKALSHFKHIRARREDDGKILNPTGLRGDDEFVRHKTLDCLGDLYLLGMTMKAKLVASRPGHAASTALLKLLKSRPEAFEVVKGNSPVALTPSWSMPDAAVASPSQ